MKIKTFKGGIHPKEYKELSNQCPITPVFPKTKTVTIPVTMGGAPNHPVVNVGDEVARGQIIATGDGFMNCPVHSSVSGKVKKIQSNLVTANGYAQCIIIEVDDSNREQLLPVIDPFECSKQDALARIKEAGIVGMGGASFPSHVKLNPPADKTIDYVLINAAECEPYLTCDERTMIESPAKVVDGLAIVLHIINGGKTASSKGSETVTSGHAEGIIVLEDNKKYIQPLLEREIAAAGYENKMSVCLVKTKYPQGAEKFIVSAATGREIPSAKLPADAGCVICNIGSVCSISDAFRLGLPLIERSLTISGGGVEKPINIRVPVGTIVSDLIPDVFNLKTDDSGKPVKIISGGPMMGFAMISTDFPIAKGTSGVTFLTEKETFLEEESQCISCGSCVAKCAMRLSPALIVRELKSGNLDKAKSFGLMDCIECGCCAFVCPAKVNLIQRIRLGKGLVRQKMAEEKAKAAAKEAAAKSSEGGK